ncbi:hypothetical protein MTO96_020909 [Rhipicephalus appendiculatus]
MDESEQILPQVSAMSFDAAEKVCATLYCLPFEELYALENCHFPWLYPVRRMGLSMAVDSVRRSFMGVSDEQQRFECIAKLHAWLIPRPIYRKWFLYHLPQVLSKMDRTYTRSSFVNAFNTTGKLLGHGSVDTGTALCLTVMVVDDAFRTPECTPICFSIWHGLPFVAVHTSGMTGYQAKYRAALVTVLGDLDKSFCSTCDDLNSLHIEAKRRAKQSLVQDSEQVRENNQHYDQGDDTRTSFFNVCS